MPGKGNDVMVNSIDKSFGLIIVLHRHTAELQCTDRSDGFPVCCETVQLEDAFASPSVITPE